MWFNEPAVAQLLPLAASTPSLVTQPWSVRTAREVVDCGPEVVSRLAWPELVPADAMLAPPTEVEAYWRAGDGFQSGAKHSDSLAAIWPLARVDP